MVPNGKRGKLRPKGTEGSLTFHAVPPPLAVPRVWSRDSRRGQTGYSASTEDARVNRRLFLSTEDWGKASIRYCAQFTNAARASQMRSMDSGNMPKRARLDVEGPIRERGGVMTLGPSVIVTHADDLGDDFGEW